MKPLIPLEPIERYIFIMRGHRVMLDRDLARIYGVSTKRLNEQVKRNRRRFPEDFMFQLTKEEAQALRSQNATLEPRERGQHRKYLPTAFTEHGAVMLAAVLNSDAAVAASIRIVRIFNRLRRMALARKDLALALAELARKVSGHDKQFEVVFEALRELTEPPAKPRRQIGFMPPSGRWSGTRG